MRFVPRACRGHGCLRGVSRGAIVAGLKLDRGSYEVRLKSPPSGNSRGRGRTRAAAARSVGSGKAQGEALMESLARFLVYNLGASVLGGFWALALVFVAMRVFGISRAVTRNQLMTIPLIKSTTVLLGLFTVMPFPAETWRTVEANAIDFATIAPVFFLLLGLFVLAVPFVRSRVASRLLTPTDVDHHPRPGSIRSRSGFLSRLRPSEPRVFARARP